ncbi:MAG: MCE family protein [Bacteroidetes bacterium]|nr:MCE family protein [Bacteroidota bacterium]
MKISNETKVGVLAALAITIMIVGYNFMKGESLFSKNKTYYAVYDQVDGLFRSNPVLINGYKIGQVNSVTMDQKTLKLIVSITIPNEIIVPRNSILKITNNDLLGSKAIELMLDTNYNKLAQDGDTLISARDAGMAQALTNVLTPLSEKVKTVLSKMDTSLTDVNLQSTLNDLSGALNEFKTTAQNLNQVLKGKGEKLDEIIGNINFITKELKTDAPRISAMIASLEKTTSELEKLELGEVTEKAKQTLDNLNSALKDIDLGDGSLSKLIHDDALYVNLNSAAKSIDSLAKDMQLYPRRYTGVFEKQRKKGDKQKEVHEHIKLPTEVKP